MKKQILTLFVLAAIPTFSFAETTYTVKAGDTLLSIADKAIGNADNKKNPRRYQFAQKIKALNPRLKNPNSLTPGETLTLPEFERPTKAKVLIPPPAPLPEPEHEAPAMATEPVSSGPAIPIVKPTAEPTPTPAPPIVEAAPAPTAPAEMHAEEAHAEAHGDTLSIQPRYHFTHIKFTDLATEEETKVDAKTSAGIDLQYAKALSEKMHLLITLGMTSTQYKELDSTTLTLEHLNETQKNYGLGLGYELSPSWHFDVMAKMADRTFILPVTTGTYEVHSVLLPGAEAALSWDFIQTKSFVVGASLIGEYIGGATKDGVTYKSTVDPLGVLYWASTRGADKVNYRFSATYDKRDQNTDVTEQAEESWIAGLTLSFPL